MSNPLEFSNMEYFVHEKVGEFVYSIDRLSIYYPLVPKKLFVQLRDEVTSKDFSKQYFPESFIAKRFGNPVSVVQYCGVHYEFWIDTDKRYGDKCRIRLDWNPNKVMDEPRLMRLLDLLSCFGWCVRRVDYAIDIPRGLDEVYVTTRKMESFFRSTRYYGTRHNSGYLRVYDKALEQGLKGEKLTRLEWEQHGNIDFDFTFDRFCFGDFSRCSDTYLGRLVRFVSPECFNSFVNTADYKTRQKFFDGLERYYVSDNTFYCLLQELFARYNLAPAYRCENEKVSRDDALKEMDEFKTRFPFAYQWLYGENSGDAVDD